MKLSSKNATSYLEYSGVFQNVNWKRVKVTEIKKHTNVNFVFRVNLNGNKHKTIYLKQAFGFVKVAPKFPAPIDRQKYEKLSIDYLQGYWEGRIPEVIFYDEKSNVLAISDVGKGAVLLAEEIKKGNLHLEVSKDLGKVMTRLHSPTFDKGDYPVRDKKANQYHLAFILNFRLRGSREVLPKETDALFKSSLKSKTSIIYGDWASKNVFVVGKIRVVNLVYHLK